MIGVGLSIVQLAVRQLLGGTFSPIDLFTTGVTGAWYDPSDINLTWRRNLLTYSEQFDNSAWTKINTSVSSNVVVAPDGTLTADKLIESTINNGHGLDAPSVTITSGTAYTATVYAKQGERRYLFLALSYALFQSGNGVCFDLQTGTVAATGTGSSTAGTITPCGNDWYRCSITLTATSTGSSIAQPAIYLCQSARTSIETYAGDGYSGIYIWGAQLEQDSTATPYQRITDGIQDYLQYQAQPVLYQDAAGTQPVTAVEQPVGLMLDKSKGLVLGSELYSTSAWLFYSSGNSAANISISGSQITFTPSIGAPGWVSQQLTGLTAGRCYKITYRVVSASTTPYYFRVGSGIGLGENYSITSPTTGSDLVVYVAATANNFFLSFGIGAGGSISFTNISVRELPGNHAFNSSGNSANFPVLSERKNKLLATAALATQNVTVRAVGHVLSFWGTGTITLSGASTAGPLVGTGAGNRVYLEFTPTAGTLTLTVSGSVLKAQLEEINETV